MRVVGFFLYCFAAITAPLGIGFGLLALRAPAFRIIESNAAIESGVFASIGNLLGKTATASLADLRDEYPSSQAAAGAVFGDSTAAFVFAYADNRNAHNAAGALVERLPTASQTSGPGGVRYASSESDVQGLVRTIGRYVVWTQGPSRELVDSRFAALPSVERNPDTNFANAVIDQNFLLFLAVIMFWVLLQVFIWPRYASWAGTARAPMQQRRAPVDAKELVSRFAALEGTDGPVRVGCTRRNDELLAEWRYDSGVWVSLMAAGGVSLVRRIRMRVDEKRHRILARDEQSTVSWEIGSDGSTVAKHSNWKTMRGIVFLQYERAVQHSLTMDDGAPRFGKNYSFKFDVRELRAPVIAVLKDAGWDYRPVFAFNRLFGG